MPRVLTVGGARGASARAQIERAEPDGAEMTENEGEEEDDDAEEDAERGRGRGEWKGVRGWQGESGRSETRSLDQSECSTRSAQTHWLRRTRTQSRSPPLLTHQMPPVARLPHNRHRASRRPSLWPAPASGSSRASRPGRQVRTSRRTKKRRYAAVEDSREQECTLLSLNVYHWLSSPFRQSAV